MQAKICLKVVLTSWDYGIWVSSTNFLKSYIFWLNSLWQKLYQILVKIWIFMINSTKRGQYWSFWWQIWSNHQNQEVLWVNRVVEVAEASEAAEAGEVNEAGEASKAWKMTIVDFKVFQVLEFNNFRTNITLFWCFEKKIFLTESWKLMLNICTFSV